MCVHNTMYSEELGTSDWMFFICSLYIQISDFGMSRDVSDDYFYSPKGGRIPLCWTAPEAVLYRKYTTKSDVWSYGMVMYEIWSLGHRPFEDMSVEEVHIVQNITYVT